MSLEAELHLVFDIAEGVVGLSKRLLDRLNFGLSKDMVNFVCVYKCVSVYVYCIDIFRLLISQSPGCDNRRIIQPLSRALPSMGSAYAAIIPKPMLCECT